MKLKYETYAQKMAQATREAKATAIALAVIVIAWIALGFGLAGSDLRLFHLPIWVVGGTLGVLIVSVIVAAVLRYAVFADFDLDDDDAIANDAESAAGIADAPSLDADVIHHG